MSPEQALEILKSASAQARLILADHVACQQAYDVLKATFRPADKPVAEQPQG